MGKAYEYILPQQTDNNFPRSFCTLVSGPG